MDILSNTFSTIVNNEMRNKRECIVSPASKLVGSILRVLQQNGYVGKFEFIDDGRSGKFDVQLLGRVNKCGAIRPRHSIKVDDIENWEKKFLPSRELGMILLSTSAGVLSHKDAKQKNIGGVLLAYIY
jgi:small subunit ribosomal protein S8